MNWLILVSGVVFALVAAIIGILGFRTFRAIKNLGVGKSFWVPVFLSGVLFFVGSVFTILHEVDFSLTSMTVEVVSISQLLALCILLVGVYRYSRRVSENFVGDFSLPEKVAEESSKMDAPVVHADPPVQRRILQGNLKTETTQECKHHFRYLQSLPRGASVPGECLSCHRIIECKHSLEKSELHTPPLKA